MITIGYKTAVGESRSISGTRGKLRVLIETLDVTQSERINLHRKLSTIKTPKPEKRGRRIKK